MTRSANYACMHCDSMHSALIIRNFIESHCMPLLAVDSQQSNKLDPINHNADRFQYHHAVATAHEDHYGTHLVSTVGGPTLGEQSQTPRQATRQHAYGVIRLQTRYCFASATYSICVRAGGHLSNLRRYGH